MDETICQNDFGYCDPCVQQLYSGEAEGSGFQVGDFKNDHFLTRSRRRFFGGSTNSWGNWCRPTEPYIFQPRPGVCEKGWPIDYSELLKFYHQAVKTCQLGAFEFDNPDY